MLNFVLIREQQEGENNQKFNSNVRQDDYTNGHIETHQEREHLERGQGIQFGRLSWLLSKTSHLGPHKGPFSFSDYRISTARNNIINNNRKPLGSDKNSTAGPPVANKTEAEEENIDTKRHAHPDNWRKAVYHEHKLRPHEATTIATDNLSTPQTTQTEKRCTACFHCDLS